MPEDKPPSRDASSSKTAAGRSQQEQKPFGGLDQQTQNLLNHLSPEKLAKVLSSVQISQDVGAKEHKFWQTQPIPQSRAECPPGENAPIETPDHENLRTEPFPLPEAYAWSNLDLKCPDVTSELYTLLYENYVEDGDSKFRFQYTGDFLGWALGCPGMKEEWCFGVRIQKTGKLVAFISAVPARVNILGTPKLMVEVNFLCIHKKLRSKRLAPVLIREVTRRCNLQGIFQALYTAGVPLPGYLCKCRYYHRQINPKKLVECHFASVPANKTLRQMIKMYSLPDEPKLPLRPLERRDIPVVARKLKQYLGKHSSLFTVFNEAEAYHFLLPREGVLYSYCVTNEYGHITDFFSFYVVPSSVINNNKHKVLQCAYLYYYFTADDTDERLKVLMRDLLIMAKKNNSDVVNCLDALRSEVFLKELRFGAGDGDLHYYIYNWKCRTLESKEVGVVLL